ncbi:MAG: hypothetical protein P8J79_08705 [Halioglobus sp.]|nr:hypothetical protein [Halioglobus sp.]
MTTHYSRSGPPQLLDSRGPQYWIILKALSFEVALKNAAGSMNVTAKITIKYLRKADDVVAIEKSSRIPP